MSDPWKAEAKCRGLPPDLFVPSAGGSTKAAKAICNGDEATSPCPVRRECLQFAKDNGLQGIFGGQMYYPDRHLEVIVDIQDGRPTASSYADPFS